MDKVTVIEYNPPPRKDSMATHSKKFTLKEIELLIAQRGNCFYCGFPMPLHTHKQDLGITKDHFIPKSKGGGKDRNLVLCHFACNQAKNNKDPTKREVQEFNRLRGVLRANRCDISRLFDYYERCGREWLTKG